VNDNTQSWKVKLQMHDVGVISVRAMKSEHTSNDNSKILKLLTKQQEMLDKQQKQIDRLSKARKYSSTISSNTYSSHKSESNINYQVTCYKCGGKGHTRPECPSPFQAQRSDEDAQKPHTNVQYRSRDIGYRGRYSQRGNRGQGRGTGVPSGSEELKE
jgi:hypothetical protein